MSLFKKIVSSVCAISMIAALAVVNVSATNKVAMGVKYDEANYNATTGEGVATVSLSNLSSELGKYAEMCAEVAGVGFDVIVSGVDTAYYSRTKKDTNVKLAEGVSASTTVGMYQAAKTGFTVSMSSMMLMDDSSDLITIAFKLTDVNATAKIEVKNIKVSFNTYDEESGEKLNTYALADADLALTSCTIASATATPVVTEAPTPEPTPEVTPEPTTGKGVEKFADNDAAAWAWKTAAAEGSSVKVTVNANGETATQAFALKANVDATVKVGVIVQYNPTTFTSFEITDIVVE